MNDFHENPNPHIAPPLGPEAALDLTRSILARTSGSPCQRLQDLACAFVDGELEADQSTLVRAHLDHCDACAALVKTLTQTQAVLPNLVELDPGPWFTQRVLRATVHLPPRPAFDLGRAWKQLMHRPRIALEAAYLGAAASLMGVYLPLPLPHLAAKVPALVQPLTQPLGASAQRIAGQVVQAEQRTTASLEAFPLRPRNARSLWQRLSARFKTKIQSFRKAEPRAPKNSAEGKKAPPANP
ncbi:hypothetical protein GETHLI_26710 [Geothrix limicola]|uniref:Putative zinc-finger domain-containing protein n=1 Tax=Geothrix limicola TaxID=2927978 RepID=A0ABQ5QH27_9BACT|nr:zf-HC2 domain-containing protein [Geothrix limicola]GLH74169.1 hypothetical protein GETHLI_26710 [Geothrix limicola]